MSEASFPITRRDAVRIMGGAATVALLPIPVAALAAKSEAFLRRAIPSTGAPFSRAR